MKIIMQVDRLALQKGDVLTVKKASQDHYIALHESDGKLYVIKKNWVVLEK